MAKILTWDDVSNITNGVIVKSPGTRCPTLRMIYDAIPTGYAMNWYRPDTAQYNQLLWGLSIKREATLFWTFSVSSNIWLEQGYVQIQISKNNSTLGEVCIPTDPNGGNNFEFGLTSDLVNLDLNQTYDITITISSDLDGLLNSSYIDFPESEGNSFNGYTCTKRSISADGSDINIVLFFDM